jgi:hypothetical protein
MIPALEFKVSIPHSANAGVIAVFIHFSRCEINQTNNFDQVALPVLTGFVFKSQEAQIGWPSDARRSTLFYHDYSIQVILFLSNLNDNHKLKTQMHI